MVAEETKLFMRASVVIFKMLLQVVADEKGIFRSISRKNFKKIILPKLDRISKINFPTTWSEEKTPLLTNVDRSGVDLYLTINQAVCYFR